MLTVSGMAGLLLLAGALVSAAAVFWVRGRSLRVRASVVAAALGFQLIHVFEHGLQAGIWADNPSGRPWMSAWAEGTASGVGAWCSLLATSTTEHALGPEMLHLLGNVIFLAGLAVMVGLGDLVHGRRARTALAVQSFHVFEHVLLTGTLIVTGSAHGLSTVLDDVLPVGGTTARVVFHFGINAVATVYAIAAVYPAGWRRWADALGVGPDREVAGDGDRRVSQPL